MTSLDLTTVSTLSVLHTFVNINKRVPQDFSQPTASGQEPEAVCTRTSPNPQPQARNLRVGAPGLLPTHSLRPGPSLDERSGTICAQITKTYTSMQ